MTGIHHVTAISGKARRNLDFYTHVLGLRFVKKTVNFEDPTTYHLYYGDSEGRPGTILTFFAWEDAAPGRAGVGLTQETAFRVPASSIGYWTHRFVEKGVTHEALERRELRAQGTLVIGVYAGYIDTAMTANLMAPKSDPVDIAASVLDGIERGSEDIFADERSRSV